MAKETAKRNVKKNAARMRVFAAITAVVNGVYIVAILARNGGLPAFRDLLAIGFWLGQEYLAYTTLNALAQPTYGAAGELLDCIDAANPKELGYYTFVQDVLWVCWVVQPLCIVHPAFIVFYLPVPATVLYKLWGAVLKPLASAWFNGGGGGGSGVDGGGADDNSGAPRSRQERRKEELQQRKAARRGRSSAE